MYAGLEFGAECYCGHKIQAPNTSDSECNMECKGEKSNLCGGANRLSIHRLELSQESARRCEPDSLLYAYHVLLYTALATKHKRALHFFLLQHKFGLKIGLLGLSTENKSEEIWTCSLAVWRYCFDPHKKCGCFQVTHLLYFGLFSQSDAGCSVVFLFPRIVLLPV